MSQYKTGLASTTNGSATVTGSNTLWSANVSAGDSFTIASTGVVYDVAAVNSNTIITLSVAYAGPTASGAVYAIGTSFTVPDNFPEMSQGDIETATIFTRGMRKIQGKFSALVSDISGKADQATTYTETEVDGLLDDKAAIAGQVFSGSISATNLSGTNTGDQTKSDIDGLGIDANTLDGIDSTGFDAAGDADTAVSDHVAETDPHTQYADIAGGTSANFTAMPQVGGDPIVESGSNADGEWTRWADGTQVCRYVIREALVSVGATRGYYYKAYASQPYSRAFVDETGSYVSSYITVDSSKSMLDIGTEGNTGISGVAWPTFVIKSVVSFNATGRIMRMATGFWK